LNVETIIFWDDFLIYLSSRPLTQEDIEKFRNKTKELALKNAELVSENDSGIKQLNFKMLFNIYFLIAQIGGLILMRKGFKLWYDRLQKYQDQIIKNQAQGNT